MFLFLNVTQSNLFLVEVLLGYQPYLSEMKLGAVRKRRPHKIAKN